MTAFTSLDPKDRNAHLGEGDYFAMAAISCLPEWAELNDPNYMKSPLNPVSVLPAT